MTPAAAREGAKSLREHLESSQTRQCGHCHPTRPLHLHSGSPEPLHPYSPWHCHIGAPGIITLEPTALSLGAHGTVTLEPTLLTTQAAPHCSASHSHQLKLLHELHSKRSTLHQLCSVKAGWMLLRHLKAAAVIYRIYSY